MVAKRQEAANSGSVAWAWAIEVSVHGGIRA